MGGGSFLTRHPHQEDPPANPCGCCFPRGSCSLPLDLLTASIGTRPVHWGPAQFPTGRWKPPIAGAVRRSGAPFVPARSQVPPVRQRSSADLPGGAITWANDLFNQQRRQACRPVATATLRARPARSARPGVEPPQSLAVPRRPRALLMGPHASRCPHSLIRRASRRARRPMQFSSEPLQGSGSARSARRLPTPPRLPARVS